jgi:hypothetical protein
LAALANLAKSMGERFRDPDAGKIPDVLRCQLMGHRPRFSSSGETLSWECERGCGARGTKRYPSAAEAARYAKAFDREDRKDIGRRPLLSLLPLGLARKSSRRR